MNYIAKNEIMKYWRIRINSDLNAENCSNLVFKGKTVENAIKAAKRYCKELNARQKWQTLTVDEVLYECDFWGRKI